LIGTNATGTNDIKEILSDLYEGKITKVEAKQLIKTVLRRSPRKIRVRVRNDDGKNVNIVVPITMIGRAIGWVAEEVNGVDIRSKIESVIDDEDFRGEVVNVTTEDDERVVVTIE
jgi:hypothetical protein